MQKVYGFVLKLLELFHLKDQTSGLSNAVNLAETNRPTSQINHFQAEIQAMPTLEENDILKRYPASIQPQLMQLRRWIRQVAAQQKGLKDFTETEKWNEPAYLCKHGSTIRIGWNSSRPEQYLLLFHCKTSLVETFRELYPTQLRFQGNRAIVFEKEQALPEKIIKHCIALSLQYHKIKHLPLLGN